MPRVRPAGAGFFPLDAELGLLPNQHWTPRLEAAISRLGQLVDFAEAAVVLQALVGVVVSEATVRRHTYAAGEAAVAVEAQALAQVGQGAAAAKPERVQLSIDATKVPLVGGQWTDVKLGVFADLRPGVDADGRPTLEAVNLSYAARWEPAEQFGQTLTLEAQRRGVLVAPLVVSPNDGADWIQGNLDLLAPAAIRILDEPHAAEHLATIGALISGEGTEAAKTWTATQRQRLKAEPPAGVLAELARCGAQGPRPSSPLGPNGERPADVLAREIAYFQKRAAQIQYAAFRAAGYPIGSGIVESGHKVVIGARFKGAGQHWAPAHLNPLLVLRTISCNGRWDETWPQVWHHQETTTAQRRRVAQAQRQAARCAAAAPGPEPPVATVAVPPTPPAAPRPPSPRLSSATAGPRRPAANHPWLRGCLRSAQRSPRLPNPKI